MAEVYFVCDEVLPQVFAAMDVKVPCNRKFSKEFRHFSDFPEFVLNAEDSKVNAYQYSNKFVISVERLNALYKKLVGILGDSYTTRHGYVYPFTIHEMFSLSTDIWATPDLQGAFYCPTPELPEEYKEWADLAKYHDYTFRMSDSSSAYNNGLAQEERMRELRTTLDNKVCTLWYNFILGRMRKRPQDGSFGIHLNVDWNTYQEALKCFQIVPTEEPAMVVPESSLISLEPCKGFPEHPKKIGWMEGDIKGWGYFLKYPEYIDYLPSSKAEVYNLFAKILDEDHQYYKGKVKGKVVELDITDNVHTLTIDGIEVLQKFTKSNKDIEDFYTTLTMTLDKLLEG